MVDAILSFAVENLLNLAKDEAMQWASLKKNLEDLSNELRMMKAVIKDAEMKQIKDETIRIWLQNLKYAAYDIEDMLEDWDQVRNSSSLFSCAMRPIRQSKFAHKVISIKEKLRKISLQKDRYGFREISVRETDHERQTFSFVEQSNIVGRDGDKEILIRKLIENDPSRSEGKIPAISIVGMGGLGKTTLAQVLFNTKTVKNHFEKCIWVCVSNEFNTKVIMINIVKNGGGIIKNDDNQVEVIREEVLKIIGNKRYLLVLEDVWNENALLWEPLQIVLNSGASESRIIVTTRNTGVAHAIRSEFIHDVGLLSNEDCWSIFKKNVFEKTSESEQGYNEMEKIGKEIVEKCGGIPLAVKSIASAIRKKARGRKPTREQLNDILSNEIWDVSMDSNIGILPALMLSYIELPSALKNCFCYCSLFEKDFIFKKDYLTKLWVAQGYINAKDGQRDIEHVAEECFYELLDRSLFQEPVKDEYGMVTSCKMHDRVHDLAQWLTKSEISTMKKKQPGENALMLGDARHCTIWTTCMLKRDIALRGAENLRSLLYLRVPNDEYVHSFTSDICLPRGLFPASFRAKSLDGLGRLVHLRCLDLGYTRIRSLPRSIGKLKLLQYLDLTHTLISRLPESITSLPRLQTLVLRECPYLNKLPARIPEMSSLRHLDVSDCFNLEKLPDGIGKLTLLQTLRMFPVNVRRGGGSNIGELGKLSHLRGRLLIHKLEAVVSKDEALTAKLRDKTSLGSLWLWWRSSTRVGVKDYTGVLEGLHPPPSLVRLKISCYPGDTFPSWMGDATSFLHLCQVNLETCEYCTLLPPLGRLPGLIKLIISGLIKVETVGDEFLFGVEGAGVTAFPKLEYLKFGRMYEWESWTTSLPPLVTNLSTIDGSSTIMPRLSKLSLKYCRKLKEVPSIFTHNLQKLTVEHCSDTLMKSCEEGGDLWPFIRSG